MGTLKDFRLANGVKIKAVADHIGVSRQTYSNYENNQDEMSIEQAKAACSFLGCSIDQIFLSDDVK